MSSFLQNIHHRHAVQKPFYILRFIKKEGRKEEVCCKLCYQMNESHKKGLQQFNLFVNVFYNLVCKHCRIVLIFVICI